MTSMDLMPARKRRSRLNGAATDLGGFLDRLRATVVSTPLCIDNPADALLSRIDRENRRIKEQEMELERLCMERRTLDDRVEENKRVIYDLTTQAAALNTAVWDGNEKLAEQQERIQQFRFTATARTRDMRKLAHQRESELRTQLEEVKSQVLENDEETVKPVIDHIEKALSELDNGIMACNSLSLGTLTFHTLLFVTYS
ncbi:hypothetical protein DFJ77DRAFT_92874 [Powellomyces hirtus]|nr:hypothetical protein DFJ77DRAFT_282609 [Powellomyces hirtus]KAI8911276.1 hypothetical protein DFJ77DRAFT_92874 [Powellomyces hirtus]